MRSSCSWRMGPRPVGRLQRWWPLASAEWLASTRGKRGLVARLDFALTFTHVLCPLHATQGWFSVSLIRGLRTLQTRDCPLSHSARRSRLGSSRAIPNGRGAIHSILVHPWADETRPLAVVQRMVGAAVAVEPLRTLPGACLHKSSVCLAPVVRERAGAGWPSSRASRRRRIATP